MPGPLLLGGAAVYASAQLLRPPGRAHFEPVDDKPTGAEPRDPLAADPRAEVEERSDPMGA